MSLEIFHATDPSTLTRIDDRIRSDLEEFNFLYSSEKNFSAAELIGKNRIFDSGGYSYKIGVDIDFNQVLDKHIDLAERNRDVVVPHDRSYHRPHETNHDFIKENLELVDVWGNFGFDNLMYALHARSRDDIVLQLEHITSQYFYDIDYVGIGSSEVNTRDRNWNNREVALSLLDMTRVTSELAPEYGITDIHFFALGGSYTIPLGLMMGCNTVDSSTPETRAARGVIYLPVRSILEHDLPKLNYYVGSPWGRKNEAAKLDERQKDLEILSRIEDELPLDHLQLLISDNKNGNPDENYIYRVYHNCLSTIDDIKFWSDLIKQNDDAELRRTIHRLPARSISSFKDILLDSIDYVSHIEKAGPRYHWYFRQETLEKWF